MRAALILAIVVSFSFLTAPCFAADTSEYKAFIDKLPASILDALGTETISLNLAMTDGTIKTIGIKTDKGMVKEYQEGAYPDPTMAIHVSQDVLNRIQASDDPVPVIKDEWGKGIRLEGLTFGSSIKLFFVDIMARLFFFFSGGGSKGTAENTAALCSNGFDDDSDSAVDCQDTDCEGLACNSKMTACPKGSSGGGPDSKCGGGFCNKINYVCRETDCSDSTDNEQDGKTDCADSDCDGQTCKTTPPPAGSVGPVRTDTCVNSACKQGANPWTEINCNDGVDNDLDGKKDMQDCDCANVDFIPAGVAKVKWNDKYNYTASFKNQGTAASDPRTSVFIHLNKTDGTFIGYCSFSRSVGAANTDSCLIVSSTDVSKVVETVIYYGTDCDTTNNMETLDVK